jgi:fermentation-respiration switch protein FrsA (DUF1100 family)
MKMPDYLIAILITAGVLCFFLIAAVITALICYLRIFYSPKKPPRDPDSIPLPEGEVYKPLYDGMIKWVKWARSLPHTDITIKSYDGLTLSGRLFELSEDAPLEIMFHGYRGEAERDLSGGIERCFSMGRSALLINQRGHGGSSGRTVSFGIKDKRDCRSWIDYCTEKFPGRELILTGVSMGAATVMMAAGEELPDNVSSVLADCGYTSAKAIIMLVMKNMGLPAGLLYPFVKLGARLFGGFDPDADSPIEAVRRCKKPIMFIHGDIDDFVPYSMSEELYAACAAPHKRHVCIKDAGHGICYPIDKEKYTSEMLDFEKEYKGA